MLWLPFQEAFASTPHEVMGKRLRPFCLYYQFWLDFIESPLWTGKRPASLIDLEIATRLCSCDYGEAERIIQEHRNRGRFHAWYWKVLGRWIWALKALRFNTKIEAEKFHAYIHSTYSPPEFHGSSRRNPAEEFPPVLGTVCWLVEWGGWAERRVWMLPLGRAHWYVTGYLRNKGVSLKLVTERDKAERALRSRILAEAEAKLGRKLTPKEAAGAYMQWIREQAAKPRPPKTPDDNAG